jgi:CRP/FNR family transcriptional regulator, cyclic AMP receptor protein
MGPPRRLSRTRNAQLPAKLFDVVAFLANAGIGKTLHRYKPKQKVFSQGERPDAVFYIQEGRVRVSVLSKFGKEATITLLGPGDFVGEGCIASDQSVRVSTATALSNCSLLRVERTEMLRTLHGENIFSDMFVAYVVKRFNRTEADLVDQLFNSSEKRLARALLTQARFGKTGKPEALIPNISQKTLAEMIGTTRQRVNFFMNRFKKLGYVKYNDGLQVHRSLLRVVLHE